MNDFMFKDKRQCYLAGEKQLKYYGYYTAFNCVDECIANHTFEVCTCVQYYMPREFIKLIDLNDKNKSIKN